MIESDRVPGAQSLYVDAGGRRLHYLRAGDGGPPVVLVHGSGIDDAGLSWRHAIPALAESFDVYALDLPGYGDSPDPEEPPTAAYYADVLADFADALSLDRPGLVGISMGGAAALGVAVRSPERVGGLVLVSSYGLRDAIPGGTGAYLLANAPFAATLGRHVAGSSRAGARATIAPFVEDADALEPAFLTGVRDRLSTPGAGDAFVAFQRSEFNRDGVETHYEAELPALSPPTLFVHGAEDELVPVEWATRAAEQVPDADLVLLEDCGHIPPRECPAAFHDAIEPFLAANAGGQS